MRKKTIRDLLKDKIPENKLNLVTRSFEVVGDIAITEIDDELKEYEKLIGKAICELNKSIKVVLKKKGNHKGEFRTQDLEFVYGENRKETIYNENNVKLLINPEKVYFSARLSTEREQLMNNLKENESLLVMFSGIGPYSFVAFRKQPNINIITSIELNPIAHKYALKNKDLNKSIIKKSNLYKNILEILKKNKIPIIEKLIIRNLIDLTLHFINDDVKKVIPKLKLKKLNEKIDYEKIFNFNNNFENIFEIFNRLKETDKIFLEINKENINFNFLVLYVLFSKKFNFILNDEKNSKKYLIKDDLSKHLFFGMIKEKLLNFNDLYKYDEIFMPLPKDAEFFLEDAFKVSKNNTIIHMYGFFHENDLPYLPEKIIKDKCNKNNLKPENINVRKVGQYSPRKYRICADFIVKK
jgi:tRNA G37 N-methylase Trm5